MSPMLSRYILVLPAAPCGYVRFDYQCGENCIAYIETPDDGSQVSLTLDIYNEDGTFLNTGVYYRS